MTRPARWRGWLRKRRSTFGVAPGPRIWTPSQQRATTVFAGVLLVGLTVVAIRRPYFVDNPPGPGDRLDDLADKIDPNDADVKTLGALPLLGPGKAGAVVAYRDDYVRRHPDRRAFAEPNDLLAVDGIGASTVKQLTPYLIFPKPATAAPTTR